ncbi:hypothetical protein [Nodosilinea nodulosa]|uniref:hypothetical protein n=1 Tax=Nodosilinea nodulosa TaxID=416001 RepID=UPI0002D60AF7|nr:hypothetical protein [Nodosilinea nodulosa]
MNNQASKTWTTEQLVHMSDALGGGFMPGSQELKAASRDRWTAQRHIQASTLRSRIYL